MKYSRASAAACLLWWLVTPAPAQQYQISTYAGGGPGASADIRISTGVVATDAVGNVYFSSNFSIYRLAANGGLTKLAGTGTLGFFGDGGPATKAQISFVTGLAVDRAGNVFFVDQGPMHGWLRPDLGYITSDRIRKISMDGIITTVAGGGSFWGAQADGRRATEAQLYWPAGLTLDEVGNLYFSEGLDIELEGNNRVRKVSPEGVITTVAGNGSYGFSGDGGPASEAALSYPGEVVVDRSGNILFADSLNGRIRRVSADGVISTVLDITSVAPGCATGEINSYPCWIFSMKIDRAGDLFFASPLTRGSFEPALLKLSSDGKVSTVLGADEFHAVGGGGFALDLSGDLWVGAGSSIRKVSADGNVTTVVGAGACCVADDGGFATNARLVRPTGAAADSAGNLFIADTDNHRIRRVARGGIIETVAGDAMWTLRCADHAGESGPATAIELCSPARVAVDGTGNLFIVDGLRIRKVSPEGTISLFAGDGTPGTGAGGDGLRAIEAQLAYPNSVAADREGSVFFTEWGRVRKISRDGIITTVAGIGTHGYSGDGGPALSAELLGPGSVTLDGAGNVYFVDGPRTRKVSTDGIITTVAGSGLPYRYQDNDWGDGRPATAAALWNPSAVAADDAGNLYIAETARVRKVTGDGIIHTIAGGRDPGSSGDGGLALKAQISSHAALTVDGAGNVYLVDAVNNVIRILRPIY